MSYTLGKNCKSYFSATPLTSTSYATPLGTATEVTNIKDLKISLTADKADISTRGTGGWKATAPTLKDGTVTFTMQWQTADAAFTAFQTAYMGSSEVAFFAFDGDKTSTGKQGIASNFTVTKFERSEGLTDAVTVDVELSPSSFTGWYTIP